MSRIEFIGNDSIQYRLADGVLDIAYCFTGRELKCFHDQFAADRRLPVAEMILLLHFRATPANHLEILEIPLNLLFVLRGDIGFAEGHQRFKILSRIEQ